MKKLIFVILFVFSFVSASCDKKQGTENPKETIDGYTLVWSDEFETDGPPNSANWTFEYGFVRNNELQWYQPDNAYCKDGLLVIEGKRERKPNPNYNPTSDNWKENREFIDYTSSSLKTSGLHFWLFGRFEMRAKIDIRAGLWPAFWTLGINGSWPHNGEVDIMEYYSGKILANIAWGAEQQWQAVWDGYSVPVAGFIAKDPDWANKFHVWRMDWDEQTINLYMDDILLNSADLSTTINRDSEGKNPFMQPHYIIVNLAIGGNAGGNPAGTEFPAFYEIDYVRVYQK